MLDEPHTDRLAFRPTMNRAILTAFLVAGSVFLLAIPACKDEGVGDPCTPEQEYDPSFLGFNEKEVNVESKSFQCRTRICLVNHFRGRTSCPYGQSSDGIAPAGSPTRKSELDKQPLRGPCRVPATGFSGSEEAPVAADPINGLTNAGDPLSFRDQRKKKLVERQCVDRAADKAVYCSCRCADINGDQPSGQTFCKCPDGFACSPLVTSIGKGNEGLTGSYCIKNATEYKADTACNQGDCDPVLAGKKCD